ncbi:hypothetical protein Tco_0714268 [Tanacetum coccineum]
MVAYLQKLEGSEAFHQIVDLLNTSHIKYTLIENLKIYVSLIQQFWGTTTARTTDDGEVEITARIDGQVKTITKASLRRHLKLEDSDGITSLPNTEIFKQLALMGYVSDSDRLTFQNGYFSPQWRTFNFSKMIFDAMVKNLDSTYKFLIYPRFLQICLNKQNRLLQPYTKTYLAHTLTKKLFSNMKRISKGYSRVDCPLFATMITTPELSPSRITSSPSLSPRTHQSPQSSPLRDITIQHDEIPQSQFPTQTQVADEAAFTSVDVDAGGAATTDIGLDAGQGSDEDAEEDSSKQGRKIFEIDKDPTISLVQPEQDMEYDFDVSTAEGFTTASVPVTTVGIEISTANISVSTASVTPKVSTATENLVYIRRSAEKRKDKGKSIMKEDESVRKKSKKQLEDAKIAKQLQEEFDRARQEQEVVAEADQAHDINWSDHAVLRYHAVQNRSFSKAEVRKNMCIYLKNQGGYKQSHFKGMKYEDIRPIFERVWDQNHAFVPKDSEIGKEQDDVVAEQVVKESSRKAEGRLKRKTSKARKNKDKRQKNQDDPEKLTLMKYVEVISNSKEVINVISLAVKSSIMLNDFDREDLIMLYKLFNEKYTSTRPGFDNLILWGDMKTMFEPDDDDEVWKHHHSQELIE